MRSSVALLFLDLRFISGFPATCGTSTFITVSTVLSIYISSDYAQSTVYLYLSNISCAFFKPRISYTSCFVTPNIILYCCYLFCVGFPSSLICRDKKK